MDKSDLKQLFYCVLVSPILAIGYFILAAIVPTAMFLFSRLVASFYH